MSTPAHCKSHAPQVGYDIHAIAFIPSLLVEPKLYLDANQNDILKYTHSQDTFYMHSTSTTSNENNLDISLAAFITVRNYTFLIQRPTLDCSIDTSRYEDWQRGVHG